MLMTMTMPMMTTNVNYHDTVSLSANEIDYVEQRQKRAFYYMRKMGGEGEAQCQNSTNHRHRDPDDNGNDTK